MTNTERLIYSLECAIKSGLPHLNFLVGRYTGNGPAVVGALRRRGYLVTKVPAGGVACYCLSRTQPER
jgi:hypothetical protein